MAKLSVEQIRAEVEEKGFELVSADNYKNMNSFITIRCSEGHIVEVPFSNFRTASFRCPICDQAITFENPTSVPQKTGYRVIAFDQATEKFGLSIFDDGKLVFFNLYVYTGTVINRISQIKDFIKNIVIPIWKPDFIVMEDIQYQYGAVLTFKVLAMLLGVLEVICTDAKIPYEVVSPVVWRKYAGTNGKNRTQEKQLSVAAVREKYNIRVNDDIAEAILIGRYGAHVHKPEIKMAFGIKK